MMRKGLMSGVFVSTSLCAYAQTQYHYTLLDIDSRADVSSMSYIELPLPANRAHTPVYNMPPGPVLLR